MLDLCPIASPVFLHIVRELYLAKMEDMYWSKMNVKLDEGARVKRMEGKLKICQIEMQLNREGEVISAVLMENNLIHDFKIIF